MQISAKAATVTFTSTSDVNVRLHGDNDRGWGRGRLVWEEEHSYDPSSIKVKGGNLIVDRPQSSIEGRMVRVEKELVPGHVYGLSPEGEELKMMVFRYTIILEGVTGEGAHNSLTCNNGIEVEIHGVTSVISTFGEFQSLDEYYTARMPYERIRAEIRELKWPEQIELRNLAGVEDIGQVPMMIWESGCRDLKEYRHHVLIGKEIDNLIEEIDLLEEKAELLGF